MDNKEEIKMIEDQYGLMGYSKEELILLINRLMSKLNDRERLEFISKWISPQAALNEAAAGDSERFIGRVESFCEDCLNGEYNFDVDHDNYHDYDNEFDYENEEIYDYQYSEWAEEFSTLLSLAIMYSRNKNYDISYGAFNKLWECIHAAEFDECILGTEYPMNYININWDEVFDEYFLSMKNHFSDNKRFADNVIDTWMDFDERCTNNILNAIVDIKFIEESIKTRIAGNPDSWTKQHQLYELLKKCYLKCGLEFDEVKTARSLVCYNNNFLGDLAQGMINREMWDDAVIVLKDALNVVTTRQLILGFKEKLAFCYEKLHMYKEAYDVSSEMFVIHNNHEFYLHARSLAVKIGHLGKFIEEMINHMQKNENYGSIFTLLKILSYEGDTSKLINTALKSKGYSRHDYLKYTSKSLIFRAVGSEEELSSDLKDFLHSIVDNNIPGIVDIIKTPLSSADSLFCWIVRLKYLNR